MNNHPFPSSIVHFIVATISLRWLAVVILSLAGTPALAAGAAEVINSPGVHDEVAYH